jgi:hypothetical protein
MNFITWNESWNVQIVYIIEHTWLKFDVFYFIDEIILLMLKLVSNKIDTKKLFWMKWCLFYFYLTFVYNCYVPTYHRFLRQRLLLSYIFVLLMLKLVSNKIDTYLTSFWRHERNLFSVFRGIFPAIFRPPTVFKMNTIIYRNISYLLMNFITWNESWNVQRLCMCFIL